jgi:hypothetical protein
MRVIVVSNYECIPVNCLAESLRRVLFVGGPVDLPGSVAYGAFCHKHATGVGDPGDYKRRKALSVWSFPGLDVSSKTSPRVEFEWPARFCVVKAPALPPKELGGFFFSRRRAITLDGAVRRQATGRIIASMFVLGVVGFFVTFPPLS